MRRHLAVAGSTVLLLLALLEASVGLLLAFPDRLPRWPPLLAGMRRVYVLRDWSVVQAEPTLVRHDPEVGYLLRPGVHRFRNREFDTELRVNSAGLRDDEASLVAPDLIVLGDSYALGWGVGQEETFSQLLERRTGLKVLNAGMSSFGTARETLLAGRLDRSRTQAVVVQYFANDFGENRAFVAAGMSLATRSEASLRQAIADHARTQRYRPLAYLGAFLSTMDPFPELRGVSIREVARTGLLVLAEAEALDGLPILFFELDPYGAQQDDLVEAMTDLVASDPGFADLRSRLTLLRLAGLLSPDDAYRLDPHLRPSGHSKIAHALCRALNKQPLQSTRLSSATGSGELPPSGHREP